jgi:hypothetical protein
MFITPNLSKPAGDDVIMEEVGASHSDPSDPPVRVATGPEKLRRDRALPH